LESVLAICVTLLQSANVTPGRGMDFSTDPAAT